MSRASRGREPLTSSRSHTVERLRPATPLRRRIENLIRRASQASASIVACTRSQLTRDCRRCGPWQTCLTSRGWHARPPGSHRAAPRREADGLGGPAIRWGDIIRCRDGFSSGPRQIPLPQHISCERKHLPATVQNATCHHNLAVRLQCGHSPLRLPRGPSWPFHRQSSHRACHSEDSAQVRSGDDHR